MALIANVVIQVPNVLGKIVGGAKRGPATFSQSGALVFIRLKGVPDVYRIVIPIVLDICLDTKVPSPFLVKNRKMFTEPELISRKVVVTMKNLCD